MTPPAGRVRRGDHPIRYSHARACGPVAGSRTIPHIMRSAARAPICRALASTLTAGASLLATAPPAASATVERASITVGEGERHYLLVRPDHAPDGPRPLVLILHGHGGSAAGALGRTGAAAPLGVWLEIADREGLLLAALDGAVGRDGQQSWHDCREDAARTPGTDDVAFAHAVVERLAREERADTTRLYAMGMSIGGMMTYRLALELTPPLVAFAAMGASMAENSDCAPPSRAVS